MLYRLLKIPARIAFRFYCRNILINNIRVLNSKGPLLIAANHPNSFLDAIVIATLFEKPVVSLVRGDVYINRFISSVLTSLKMLPVYRISEGAENLDQNYGTFLKCKDIFRKDGIVLIFSEGRCENEWHLRPLKKGTARLALSSWDDGIDLKVLPAGINFHSFRKFGKIIHLNFGNIIVKPEIKNEEGFGKSVGEFNDKLKKELQQLVYEIPQTDLTTLKRTFKVPVPSWKKMLLILPAVIGYIIHAPLYLTVKSITNKLAGKSGHYDSIIVAVLFGSYPLYLLLLLLLTLIYTPWAWFLLLILPFTAWSLLQLKSQFQE